MRVIIAGGRDFSNYDYLVDAIEESGYKITTVISGHATGADTLGEIYADDNDIPLEVYPADWSKYGKVAGFIRNAQMADVADSAVIMWDGKSNGTKNMVQEMKKRGLPFFVRYYNIEFTPETPSIFNGLFLENEDE